MKRLHVHVAVSDLDRSIRFYSTLFGAEPIVAKPDYAKWMLEDPRVNFAISARTENVGIDHLGIQAEDPGELKEVSDHLKRAEGPVLDQGDTTCCYAKSTKSWITDPQGIFWETFLTVGESTVYGVSAPLQKTAKDSPACCTPVAAGSHQAAQAKAESACCSTPA